MIAALIFASTLPFVLESASTLSLELPSQHTAEEIRGALGAVAAVQGVASIGLVRFWPVDSDRVVGTLHVQLDGTSEEGSSSGRATGSVDKTRSMVEDVLMSRIKGLDNVCIQIEGKSSRFCSCTT